MIESEERGEAPKQHFSVETGAQGREDTVLISRASVLVCVFVYRHTELIHMWCCSPAAPRAHVARTWHARGTHSSTCAKGAKGVMCLPVCLSVAK